MQERRADESAEDFWSRCSHAAVIRPLADYILLAAGDAGPREHRQRGRSSSATGRRCCATRTRGSCWTSTQSVGAPVAARDLRLKVTEATRARRRPRRRAPRGDGRRARAPGRRQPVRRAGRPAPALPRDELRPAAHAVVPRGRAPRVRDQPAHPRGRRHRQRGQAEDAREDRPHLRASRAWSARWRTRTRCRTTATGRPSAGGDEYPSAERGASPGWRPQCTRSCSGRRPDTRLGSSLRVGYKVLRRGIRPWTPVTEGAWHGNDTTWRMVLDLARIVTYADAAGVLHDTPRRRTLVLTDGVDRRRGRRPLHVDRRAQRHPRLRRRPRRRRPRERDPDGLRPGPHAHGQGGGAAGEVPADAGRPA